MSDESSLSAEERQHRILDRLMKHGTVQINDLVDELNVSRMTIHRDLDLLESKNQLRKMRGGATIEPSMLFESSYKYRRQMAGPQKRAVARAASEHLSPGQAVLIDDSTTVEYLAEFLPDYAPLTVITNAYHLLDRLRGTRGIDLISLGGSYDPVYESYMGLFCEQAITAVRADVVFMSMSAVRKGVAFHQNQEAARVKRAMLEAAEKKFLLLDDSKLGRSALIRLMGLDAFDRVFISGNVDAVMQAEMKERGTSFDIIRPDDAENAPSEDAP